ncbi:hypothetical protein GCM10028895_13530 [Pontibacter rugosus]
MMLGSACATKASGNKLSSNATENKTSTALASARADHLSEEMIRGLQLNNYQSQKVRDINLKVAEDITAIEEEYAGNQAKIDELSNKARAERDRYLESVLSTVQYNSYFNKRKAYTNIDKEFVTDVKQSDASETDGAMANSDLKTIE